MSNNRKSRRRRRRNLLAEYPFCYWCERFLREMKHPGGKPPDDMATIDHINSRLSSKPRPREGYTVLACPPCNQRRARQEELELGIEALHERSKRHGRPRQCQCIPEPDVMRMPMARGSAWPV